MTDYVVRDTQLTSVADAIRTKGGTSDPLAWPQGYIDAVEAIPTGGGSVSVPAKEVNFRDYDGTVVYSYTPAEFAALSAMPANPDHSGDEIPLTAQGWNWSLTDAQAYVAKYGRLEVGQMYATADGKTHVLIHLEQGRTSPMLGCCPNGTVDVDWGDGTAHSTLTGTAVTTVKWTPTHNYASPGDYDVILACTGTMGFYGENNANLYSGMLRNSISADTRNRAYQNAILKVYCANNVTSINTSAFQYCCMLSSVSISNSVISIDPYAFQYCYNLASIVIPNGVTDIKEYAFNGCYGLANIAIPNSVNMLKNYVFSGCYSLNDLTIPEGVAIIDQYFARFSSGISHITIPEGVTSVSSSAFANCYGLVNATFASTVTSIGSSAFNTCTSMSEMHFKSATPPVVSNQNAFSSLPTDCKIYVPAGSLEAYTTATNYPSARSYTYIEE